MKARYLLPLLLLVPGFASAQTTGRVYYTSPLAVARKLPFSAGVLAGNTLYVAGTTGRDPNTKGILTPTQEARALMERVKAVVSGAGMTMDDIVSVQVFCVDLRDYEAFNNVYKTYFHGHYPARAFIGAANLLFRSRFEVTAIAVRP